MAGRDELLAAVQITLKRAAATHDRSIVLEPGALANARQIADLLHDDDGDLQARYMLGWLHWHRCQAVSRGQGGPDLDVAIAMFIPCFIAGAGQLPDALQPMLADQAVPTATALLQNAAGSADHHLITATADLWKRIADATPAGHPQRAARLSNLGIALNVRFERTGVLADLDEGIEAARGAVKSAPTGHPGMPGYLSNLGIALLARFGRTGPLADLDAAIEAGREAVKSAPAGHPDLPRYMFNLAMALQTRFGRTGELGVLNEAIEAGRAAVKSAPAGNPDLPRLRSGLGTALLARFTRTGELADLHAAIQALQAAVDATPADHPGRAGMLSSLGTARRTRFELAGELADLDAAIQAGQAAVDTTPADHPDRAGHVFNLGIALLTWFERTGELADLDAAIQALQAAVDATPADHPGRAGMLSSLGIARRTRFGRAGELADLDAAIQAGQAAIDATPPDHPDRPRYLSTLGGTLWTSFGRTGRLRDLNAAIEAGQAAVKATPADHPSRAGRLSGLGMALCLRFDRTGDLPDLDAAIEAGQAAVKAIPADHPNWPMYLSNLAIAQSARYRRTGDLPDLDAAIEAGQAAVKAIPADHPSRALLLSNLDSALRTRFERTGMLADLQGAIRAEREAVEATPADHPDRAGRLSNLGIALHSRFARTGDLADLDESIEAGRAAVEATPADRADRAAILTNLGVALQIRFRKTGVLADVEAAIAAERAAVEATPADHPGRAGRLSNLGIALHSRFARTQDLADLNAAIRAGQAATGATPADHPDRARHLSNLGGALRTRFDRTGEPGDLVAASSAFVAAAELGAAAPSMRIRAARAAASMLAASEPGRAADLMDGAVRMLGEVAPRQLDRGDQQYAIGGFAGLASDAAALALADTRGDTTSQQRAARALRLLEAGRAVLLSQALDSRGGLADVRRQHPALAERFTGLRNMLDRPEDASQAITPPAEAALATAAPGQAVQERHRLAQLFAETLAEIRALNGFASFGLPPASDELLAQATSGPVVTFNVSAYRTDALLLTASGITSVQLPALTRDALIEQIGAFHLALHTAADADHSGRIAAQRTLAGVLGWLWDVAAAPVLDALGYHQSPSPGARWPRVWWAPGGLLGLLPIHAAGHHAGSPGAGQAPPTVMDRVVSSYTPTIRALRYARQHARHADGATRALVVAMPTTPGLPGGGQLPNVPAEVTRVRALLPDPLILSEPATPGAVPAGDSAGLPTRANVFAYLPGCSIAHFACHGASHPSDPSQSMLLLHDHDSAQLTVASLALIQHDQLQLVYLSACRTAFTSTTELLDEAIHLTSAFQLAGSRHVIGTLWEINDRIAVDIATSFYRQLRTSAGTLDTDRAAPALHQAVRGARDAYPKTPSLWAAYLHAGA